jgi:hypothetical protein
MTRARVRPDVNLREEDFGGLVYHRSSIYELNETAFWVLSHLDEQRTFEELAQMMSRRYGIDSERARADIESIVRECAALDLVEDV